MSLPENTKGSGPAIVGLLDQALESLVKQTGQPDEIDAKEEEATRAKQLENDLVQARIDDRAADRELRRKYASRVFRYLKWYSVVVLILLLLAGFGGTYGFFDLPSDVLSWLVGSTAAAAIGLVGIIARGLFNPSQTQPTNQSDPNEITS